MSKILDDLGHVQSKDPSGSTKEPRFAIRDTATVNHQVPDSVTKKTKNIKAVFITKSFIAAYVLSFLLGGLFSYKYWPHMTSAKRYFAEMTNFLRTEPSAKDLFEEHNKALVFVKAGDFAAAIAVWQDVITLHPEQPALYSHLANAFKLNKQPLEAYLLLKSVDKKYPLDFAIQNNLATHELENSKPNAAIKRLVNLKYNYSKSADLIFNLASAYEVNQMWSLALENYQLFLMLAPSDSLASQVRLRLNRLTTLSHSRMPARGAD